MVRRYAADIQYEEKKIKMGIIDFWSYITDMERIPFVAEHWYLVLLPWVFMLYVFAQKQRSRYIHYTKSGHTCSTCAYCDSSGYCERQNCQIYEPKAKTCDFYE